MRCWRGSPALNTTILLFLLQDGITNGAVYALLGLAMVLVFAVTRVILIPQGEFVAYGALTYATLATGQAPGTAMLAVAMGLVAFAFDLFAARKAFRFKTILRAFAVEPGERTLLGEYTFHHTPFSGIGEDS